MYLDSEGLKYEKTGKLVKADVEKHNINIILKRSPLGKELLKAFAESDKSLEEVLEFLRKTAEDEEQDNQE